MFNGNWVTNERGQEWRWWNGQHYLPAICDDAIRNERLADFSVETGAWTSGNNNRPDQIDWLIAYLNYLYGRGYRRIVLFLPAGAPTCQKFAQAQWWPMAQWRRDWFETVGAAGDTQGIKGWINQHRGMDSSLEVGVYIGWWIGNDGCSICTEYRAGAQSCPVDQALPCEGESVQGIWMACPPGHTTHQPDTTSQADLRVVWQNIQPWRAIGVTRFWFDNSSVSYDTGYEWRQFVNNPNFMSTDPPPIFGGEAFPAGPLSGTYPNRYFPEWHEFDFSSWITDLTWAERACQNGAPWNNPGDPTAHQWNPGTSPVREAAIFFSQWPRRSDGCSVAPGAPLHPHWDGIRDDPPQDSYPFERIHHLVEWYLCKGHCFWQTDLDAWSGAAERAFGFGQIMPPGDFDGDGEWHSVLDGNKDWEAYLAQWDKWNMYDGDKRTCFDPLTQRLTYYHGDMNSDGEVDQTDYDEAVVWIRNGVWGTPPADKYYLGEGGNDPQGSHRMNWNANQKWFPCEGCQPGPSNSPSLMGPP